MKSRFRKLMHLIFRTNLPKTILFNWKMLPARQAWRLPVYFYGKTTFRSLTGRVVFDGPVRSGLVKVGRSDYYVTTTVPWTIWTVRGTICFTGPMAFAMGSYVFVGDEAILKFGRCHTVCGSNVRIICFNRIKIGNTVRISWDCQLIDTAFHYIENLQTGMVPPISGSIEIGDRVWIGNRTTVSRGAILPSDTIIASNSIVNKDYSEIGQNCLLAGSPAIIKKKDVRRIYDAKEQQLWDTHYHYSRVHL